MRLTKASVMMDPDADQEKTSICPGVSNNTYLTGEEEEEEEEGEEEEEEEKEEEEEEEEEEKEKR